ncbi:hypothetical protein HPB47_018671 [Ixodes persulcatus]|uniref:Uncharacterized protein n=1 Tax=Ixodes persulcatus TaxID=34615 RepID=A0AC60QZT9_IXOPE|nr:hypothetical protein HPB47_018671 [Ixodes persulcatus]
MEESDGHSGDDCEQHVDPMLPYAPTPSSYNVDDSVHLAGVLDQALKKQVRDVSQRSEELENLFVCELTAVECDILAYLGGFYLRFSKESIGNYTAHVIFREVLKLRAEVTGLHEIIEALQRRMGQQQAAPIEASRTSKHFPLSSREELDALEARLMDEEHLTDKSELLKVLLDVRHEVHLLRQDTAQVLANQDQLAVHIAQLEQAQRPLLDAPVPPPVFILPLATMEDLEAAERRLIHPADQAVLTPARHLSAFTCSGTGLITARPMGSLLWSHSQAALPIQLLLLGVASLLPILPLPDRPNPSNDDCSGGSEEIDPVDAAFTFVGASEKKIRFFKNEERRSGNGPASAVVCDIGALTTLVSGVTCPACHEGKISVRELAGKPKGLASFLEPHCENSECPDGAESAKGRHDSGSSCDGFAVNVKAVVAARAIGAGHEQLSHFCAILGLPTPMHHKTFNSIGKKVHDAAMTAASQNFEKARLLTKEEVEKLKDGTIQKLQTCYQIAAISNRANIHGMYCAIWASYFHSCSTNTAHSHKFCPEGATSLCKHKQAEALGEPAPDHTPTLTKAQGKAVLPIYKRGHASFEHVLEEQGVLPPEGLLTLGDSRDDLRIRGMSARQTAEARAHRRSMVKKASLEDCSREDHEGTTYSAGDF